MRTPGRALRNLARGNALIFFFKTTSNRHRTVALYCLSRSDDRFLAEAKLYGAPQIKEIEYEPRTGVPASQEAKLEFEGISEFIARRGLVGELSHMVARMQVEPWFFFPEKKVTESPHFVCNEILSPLAP